MVFYRCFKRISEMNGPFQSQGAAPMQLGIRVERPDDLREKHLATRGDQPHDIVVVP